MRFKDYLTEYQRYLEGRRLKTVTISGKLRALTFFHDSCLLYGKEDVREMGEEDFIHFLEDLKERELSSGTINQYLSSLRQFFTWLYRNNQILVPSGEFVPSVKSISCEKVIFSPEEIGQFLDTIKKDLGDKVFFELLYSSALRCNEAIHLKWRDISLKSRTLKVIGGKGDRDRYVPLSKVASSLLKTWKKSIYYSANSYVFSGMSHGHACYKTMDSRFKKYLEESGIEKKGLTIHSIRHSTATHLLEAGADVRYVSELLGHKSLETTVRYTHLGDESMRRVYRTYHPRENGYFREIDSKYERELDLFRNRFKKREEYLISRN